MHDGALPDIGWASSFMIVDTSSEHPNLFPLLSDAFAAFGDDGIGACRYALADQEHRSPRGRIGHKIAPMTSLRSLPATAAFVLLLACSTSLAKATGAPYTPPAEQEVLLTGWVHVEDLSFDNTTVELEVNGEIHIVPLTQLGRFDINLPVGSEAVLRFEHPGHLTKEVIVDTHDATAGEFKDEQRHVKMAVILELERLMAGFTYAGPVGNIAFDKDGGCLAVDHTRKAVIGRRNEPMVF